MLDGTNTAALVLAQSAAPFSPSEPRWEYRETSSPTLSWHRCVYLDTEVKAGNTIYRASYGNNQMSAHMRLFAQADVAVDAKGLHLERMEAAVNSGMAL